MKKLTTLIITLMSLMVSVSLVAQMTVSGTVTDNESIPLIGVNILIKGQTTGTVSDIDGNYTLTANDGDVIVFSYTGYSSQEITIGNLTTIDIVMEEDAAFLDEVVVVGYSTQKKSNLTGAVASVNAEELEARPITNATQSLQGQVSGVWVNQASGEPGQDAATINIRGIGTLNNSDPLILVDGIEAPFGNIDPNDIESVTVLKDAASASIYGSRAANGVVLVTTKRGKVNQKPTFSYSGYAGSTDVTSTPGYIWNSQEFMNLRNEADANSGRPALYPADVVSQYSSGPNTNWFDEILKKGSIQQHNLSISGGSENTNYHISLGYLDQEGIVRNAGGSQRYNARLNLDTRVNDQFKIGASFSVSRQESDLDNVDQDGGVLARATRLGPNFPAYDDQGRLADRDRTLNSIELSTPNILAEVQALNRVLKDNRFLGSFYAEYEVIKDLKIRGTFAANNSSNDDQYFNRRFETFDWRTGDLGLVWLENRGLVNYYDETLNITSWLQATYEKSFDKHNFKFLAGANQESSNTRFFQAARTELPSNSLVALSTGNPETSTNNGGASEWALRSFFGRVNYDFDNKYLFEANIRRDGSSRFGSNNRWGVFPSFSAGWVLSEEDFFNKEGFIDFFKIRASWGQLGNQNIGNYPFASSISFSPAYTFGGAIVGAAAQTSLGNPNIKWETTTQTDIGLNVSMLNGRWEVEADYFVRNASDILFDQSNPGVTGVRTPTTVNIAEVQNKGWELRSDYRHVFNKNSALTIGFNVTKVNSEVISIDPQLTGDADRVFQGDFIIQRGSPINALYGLRSIGIFQNQAEIDGAPDQSQFATPQPGDLRYEDFNGDGVITTEDRQVLGQDNPTLLYGINLGYEIGGFDIRALFQGIGDAQIFERGRIFAPFQNSGGVSTIWEDRWTPDNTDATLPRITIGQGGVNHNVAHSAFISDRSYFRLKNLQIGYSLPADMFDKNFIQSARVFLNGTNLLTFTDYVGFDPERPPRNNNAFASYPQLKILTAGVNIKF
jgi:TonB-linked SusC/RagA family outer membrane protein